MVTKIPLSLGKNDVKTYADIKQIIDSRSVRVKLLFTVMVGLPYSGTTSLLMKLLKRNQGMVDDLNGLNVYESVLFKDSVSGHNDLQEITDIDDKKNAMLLLSLAKFLITKHYNMPILEKWKAGTLSNEVSSSYFGDFCGKLFNLMEDIRDRNELKVSITRSHGFVNFFDINVNKAVYEIVFILGGSCKSVILFNVLDLYHYTCQKLGESLNLADDRYKGRYAGEDLHLFKLHTALDYFVHNIETTFPCQRDRANAILVGTHADEFSDDSKLQKQVKHVSSLIDDYAQSILIHGALANNGKILPIKDIDDLRNLFFKIIDRL